MEKFIKLADVSDITPGRSKLVQVHGVCIAIFNAAGAFYALQDCCTGDGGSLSEGILTGSTIECPADKALFYLPTGESLDPQNLERLARWQVRIERDEIKISLPEAMPLPIFAIAAPDAHQRWVS